MHEALRPAHEPVQRASLQPEAGFATRCTSASLTKNARHVFGQAIPFGALVTTPCPVIATRTTRPMGPSGSAERPVEAVNEASAAMRARTITSRANVTTRTIVLGDVGGVKGPATRRGPRDQRVNENAPSRAASVRLPN